MNIKSVLVQMLSKIRPQNQVIEPLPVVVAESPDNSDESIPSTLSHAEQLYPSTISDAYLSGWFHADVGELFGGFQINPEDAVLDIGCGEGTFVNFCAARGAEIFFADIDADKVAAIERMLQGSPARAIHPIITDANPIPLADASLDKIIAMEVLEHVDDPAQFMAELFRVGKPGSQYLITVPDPLMEGVQKIIGPPSYFEKPNHIRVFGREEFEQLVLDTGFVIERRAFYGFYWSVWWSFFWACKQDLAPPWHPLLESWSRTWQQLLELPDGARIKAALDATMPKSQAIVARKPMH